MIALLVTAPAARRRPAALRVLACCSLTIATQNPSPAPRPDKNRARNAYQAGRRAEQSGDWKTAYAEYSEATVYDPANRAYLMLERAFPVSGDSGADLTAPNARRLPETFQARALY